MEGGLFQDIGIAILGACCLSFLAVICRLPVVLAYLLCGIIAGPWGFKLVENVSLFHNVSTIGITLLLFLAGIELHPRKLKEILGKTAFVTIISCLFPAIIIGYIAKLFGIADKEALIIGIALCFSSTILAIKMMPVSTLHHQYMGAFCIGILIFQDIIAIFAIMFVSGFDTNSSFSIILIPVKGCGLLLIAFVAEQYLLRPIMKKCEPVAETLYLFPLGWCLGLSLLSHHLGFSYEIGAFIAGLSLTRSPISQFLMDKLKLLRDFFLLFFFFSLGAGLDFQLVSKIIVPAIILSLAVIVVKFAFFFISILACKENKSFATQAALRLSQASEFSIIIATLAHKYISDDTSQLIQFTTILTFSVSSYLICNFYRTPWVLPNTEKT
jgi:glutathione-regulated potassium-efflux system ancillary protein KefC